MKSTTFEISVDVPLKLETKSNKMYSHFLKDEISVNDISTDIISTENRNQYFKLGGKHKTLDACRRNSNIKCKLQETI